MMNGERVLIVATMKNEGPYILEWVAHHLTLGVDDILVFTNDCDDGTDRILDRLGRIASVQHAPNPKPLLRGDKGSWHVMALRYAAFFNVYKDAGWIHFTDADEFLQIHVGDRTLDAFHSAALGKTGRFDAVSFTSMPFSSDGHLEIDDLPVCQQFTIQSKPYAQSWASDKPVRSAVKTMFRNDVPFDLRRNHRPLMAGFSAAGHVWIDGSANRLPALFTDGGDKGISVQGTNQLAQINHYAIKSAEAFLVKMDRGDAMGLDRLDAERGYWKSYDVRGDQDTRFTEMRASMRQKLDGFMEDPILSKLHAEAVTLHKAKAKRLRKDEKWRDAIEKLGLFGRN